MAEGRPFVAYIILSAACISLPVRHFILLSPRDCRTWRRIFSPWRAADAVGMRVARCEMLRIPRYRVRLRVEVGALRRLTARVGPRIRCGPLA